MSSAMTIRSSSSAILAISPRVSADRHEPVGLDGVFMIRAFVLGVISDLSLSILI